MLKKMLPLAVLCFAPFVLAKELAFSFDDGVNPDTNPAATQINQDILSQLKAADVSAIVFPSLIKTGTGEGLNLIADWGKAGHKIGNHSEQHLNLNKPDVTLPQYLDGIGKAEAALKVMTGWTPRYRFPFLKEGDTAEKRDGVRQWLQTHHYQAGDVTIDASDWYYNQLFKQYSDKNDTVALAKLKKAYVDHIVDRAQYYDGLAVKTLKYSPKHVYLLHVNNINAAYLGDAIAALKQKGWRIIASDTAYADPIYQNKPDNLPAGESLVWALAKAKGEKRLRYPAEDAPYEKANLERHGLWVQP